jgi:AraC family transcriptional regulator
MSSDVLATFVDAVADSLDDPQTTAADIAGRLYLSRFHFDRVVSAVAGESPAKFRRRVRLERAAYRLSTSRHTVLDIAVEAGYGSHEAFTRAFTRAHGVTPTRWRSGTSRSFFLDAPSGVHFHPPAGLRLPARGKVRSMDVLTSMVRHHVWLVGEMIRTAGQVDDATLDQPIELSVEGVDDNPTIRSLLHRLVWQLEMWLAAVDDQPFDFPESDDAVSLDELRRRHEQAGPRYLALVERLGGEGRYDETFVDALCDPPHVFTYAGMVSHVLTFAAHRRTLVLGALSRAGVDELGHGDPMKFLAEQQS